jgi:hypothetical protein
MLKLPAPICDQYMEGMWCIPVIRNLFSPAAHPNLLKTHDGTPQNFALQKRGTKLYKAINTYLQKKFLPYKMQAYENKT